MSRDVPRNLRDLPAYLNSHPRYGEIFGIINKKDELKEPLPKESIWNCMIDIKSQYWPVDIPTLCIVNVMGWLAYGWEEYIYMNLSRQRRVELLRDIQKALKNAKRLIKQTGLDFKFSLYQMPGTKAEYMWNECSDIFEPLVEPMPFSEVIEKYESQVLAARLDYDRLTVTKGKGERAKVIRFVRKFHRILFSRTNAHNYPFIVRLVKLLFDEDVTNQQVRDWVRVGETS